VALAAKDGARFIVEQVASVLPQLARGDELVISVDPSADDTLCLARELADSLSAAGAPRVRVLTGQGQGVVANFEQALAASAGEIVFLADQDDVWLEDKVAQVLAAFARSDAVLICHDAVVVNEQLEVLEPSYFAWHRSRGGLLCTLLRNSYVGSCLALRRELLEVALPFPTGIPMHDQWLGLTAERLRRACCLEEPLMVYRRHDATLTGKRHVGIAQMLAWRLALLRALGSRHP
jgi:glycosyltransferase involved in cell wall biosynthesis